jgi:adenosylcobinamide kinase/adenosylcobinamide-phosphate guanylyltransferase
LIELIIGGARSGKSALAEKKARNSQKQICYIATATFGDAEMAERIKHHQQNRPFSWQVTEEPIRLAWAIERNIQADKIILVDCLTLWLSNLLTHSDSSLFEKEKQNLLQLLTKTHADIILVSNETGLGVVPMGELSRRFIDESGWLHQQLAQICQSVTLVVAGLPLVLKDNHV